MPRYEPSLPRGDRLEDIHAFLMQELDAIQRAFVEQREVDLIVSYRVPERPRDGMIVFADGTSWDPGQGRGLYVYDGSTWELVSSGGVKGTATLNFGTLPTRLANTSVDVIGQSGLTSSSYIEVFTMAEATADHTADDVRIDPIEVMAEYLSASSFRIHGAVKLGNTYGDRKVRWMTT